MSRTINGKNERNLEGKTFGKFCNNSNKYRYISKTRYSIRLDGFNQNRIAWRWLLLLLSTYVLVQFRHQSKHQCNQCLTTSFVCSHKGFCRHHKKRHLLCSSSPGEGSCLPRSEYCATRQSSASDGWDCTPSLRNGPISDWPTANCEWWSSSGYLIPVHSVHFYYPHIRCCCCYEPRLSCRTDDVARRSWANCV